MNNGNTGFVPVPARRKRHLVIVGSGPVGALLALLLSRQGHKVQLFSQKESLAESCSGRALSTVLLTRRGLSVLEQLGLLSKLEAFMTPIDGRMVHLPEGEVRQYGFVGGRGQKIYTMASELLNRILLETLQCSEQSVSLHFNYRCHHLDLEAGRAVFDYLNRHASQVVYFDHLIGADGRQSAVREAIVKASCGHARLTPTGQGFKRLTIVPRQNGTPALDHRFVHIWPRGEHMMVAMPNHDMSFTLKLLMPTTGKQCFNHLLNTTSCLSFFKLHYPGIIEMVPNLAQEIAKAPLHQVSTLRCWPWHFRDKAVLVGGAAHSMVPFYGQGLNCGFEDAMVLDQLLRQHLQGCWREVFSEYSKVRYEDCRALADMALENYQQTRSGLLKSETMLKLTAELELEQRFAPCYQSRDTLLLFGQSSYVSALRRGQVNELILEKLLKNQPDFMELDFDLAQALLSEHEILQVERA